jgi:hypothetical protein
MVQVLVFGRFWLTGVILDIVAFRLGLFEFVIGRLGRQEADGLLRIASRHGGEVQSAKDGGCRAWQSRLF